MSHVFISYARSTAKEAEAVAGALRALGYDVWRDDELPAHRGYAEVIEERLKAAAAVVVIWSAEAAKSEWVQAEADRARLSHKLVQLSVDAASLPLPFDRIQCADLAGWSGDLTTPGWRKVVASLAELTGAAQPPATTYAPVERDRSPLLAVMAFDNLSGDPDMGFFSDGVSEEILDAVGRARDLRVISRGSSFQFRGPGKAARNVAAELNATHLLDGSVRRSGDRVRIAARLVECSSDTTVWSERFDRELSDVFAVQDEIAEAVATALKAALAPGPAPGPIDMDVYDLYLRAREFGLAEVAAQRIALLEQVTAKAPDFAPGWAWLALWLGRSGRLVEGDAREARLAQAAAAAETALRLDPNQGVAHVALSFTEPVGAYLAREGHLQRAVAAAPSDVVCLTQVAGYLSTVGRLREHLAYARQSYELDPRSADSVASYQTALSFMSRYEEAARLNAAAVELWPQQPMFLRNMAGIARHLGDSDRFDTAQRLARERGFDPGDDITRRHFNTARAARNHDARYTSRYLAGMEAELARTGMVLPVALSGALNLGQKEAVFSFIERAHYEKLMDRAVDLRSNYSAADIFHPAFAEIRSDPRFVILCAKLHLCAYWIASDRWPDCADPGVLPYDFKAEARRLAAR